MDTVQHSEKKIVSGYYKYMGKMSVQSVKSWRHSVFGMNEKTVPKTGSIFNDLGKFQHPVIPNERNSRKCPASLYIVTTRQMQPTNTKSL